MPPLDPPDRLAAAIGGERAPHLEGRRGINAPDIVAQAEALEALYLLGPGDELPPGRLLPVELELEPEAWRPALDQALDLRVRLDSEEGRVGKVGLDTEAVLDDRPGATAELGKRDRILDVGLLGAAAPAQGSPEAPRDQKRDQAEDRELLLADSGL